MLREPCSGHCALLPPGFGSQQPGKTVSPRVVPSMSVIPGLLLIKEGAQGRVLFTPFSWSVWALYSSPVVHSLCFSPFDLPCGLGQAGVKENNSAPSACTLLGLGTYLCLLGVGSPPATPGANGA